MLAHGSCALEVSGTADWRGRSEELPIWLKGLYFTHIILYTVYWYISAVSKDIWDKYDLANTFNITCFYLYSCVHNTRSVVG